MSADSPDRGDSLDQLVYTTDGRRISFVLDEDLYSREVIYGATYLFIDRAWVFLSRPADRLVDVRLTPKQPTDRAGLEALAGELANELLNQAVRQQLSDSTAKIREYYGARAFYAGAAQTSIDQLLAELDAEELEEAPLEIEVPWETRP